MLGKINVQLNDGSKSKSVLLQVTQEKGPAKIKIFENETSKRAKSEIELHESYSELLQQDSSHKTLVIFTAKQNYTMVFNSPSEAEEYLKIFNGKSNVYQDAASVKALDDQVLQIWPFPQNDLEC